MIAAVPRPPARAAKDSNTVLVLNTTIMSTAAVLAPSLMPITSGLASSLAASDWKTAPEIPKAATSRPHTARGRRSSCSSGSRATATGP